MSEAPTLYDYRIVLDSPPEKISISAHEHKIRRSGGGQILRLTLLKDGEEIGEFHHVVAWSRSEHQDLEIVVG